MPIQIYKNFLPDVKEDVYLAPNGFVIGQVSIAARSSVWFGAVVRGDVNRIEIGKESNIQDNATLHATFGGHATFIGDRVSIGHNAVLHACTVEDDCLIGIHSTVLDGAVIPKGSMVAAGSLVPPGKKFEPYSLILGNPAVAIRKLRDKEIANNQTISARYIELSNDYKQAAAKLNR